MIADSVLSFIKKMPLNAEGLKENLIRLKIERQPSFRKPESVDLLKAKVVFSPATTNGKAPLLGSPLEEPKQKF